VTSQRPTTGRLVGKIAGTYPLAETYHTAALSAEMQRLTLQVSEIVPEATGLQLPGSPDTTVIGRTEWIERNVATFAKLTEPARKRLEERMVESGPAGQRAASMAGTLMQAETGLFSASFPVRSSANTSWFSQRVKAATLLPTSVRTSCRSSELISFAPRSFVSGWRSMNSPTERSFRALPG